MVVLNLRQQLLDQLDEKGISITAIRPSPKQSSHHQKNADARMTARIGEPTSTFSARFSAGNYPYPRTRKGGVSFQKESGSSKSSSVEEKERSVDDVKMENAKVEIDAIPNHEYEKFDTALELASAEAEEQEQAEDVPEWM